MMFLGNLENDGTFSFWWNSNDGFGASVTRATDGTIKVEREDGTDCTAGVVTDSEDDPVTGIHRVDLDLSAHASIVAGYDYLVYVEGAVISGQAVNAGLAQFSIENREIKTVTGNVEGTVTTDAASRNASKADVSALALEATVATLDGVADGIKAVTDLLPDAGALNDLATILGDTNELQGDWTNGGRLDLLLDAALADTAELQADWANGGRLDLLVDAILTDTGELQADWTNGGRLDLILDDINGDTNIIRTVGNAIRNDTAAILIDTNELQADWVNGGRLDSLLDTILADTAELQADWANGGRLDLILDSAASTKNITMEITELRGNIG